MLQEFALVIFNTELKELAEPPLLFVAPALYKHEKRYAVPFLLSTIGCFIGGAAFGHFVGSPWFLSMESALGKAERLYDILKEYDVPCVADFKASEKEVSLLQQINQNNPTIVVGDVLDGFQVISKNLCIFGDGDLFDESELLARPIKSKQKSASFISDFRELKAGDYVVHVDHGIGQFRGLKQISTDGIGREFMILGYYGDDRLYVPLERLDLIQKYSSGENVHPPLDKLGGTSWIRTKARIKKSMRDMAEELLKLYAERRILAGYAFSPHLNTQKRPIN